MIVSVTLSDETCAGGVPLVNGLACSIWGYEIFGVVDAIAIVNLSRTTNGGESHSSQESLKDFLGMASDQVHDHEAWVENHMEQNERGNGIAILGDARIGDCGHCNAKIEALLGGIHQASEIGDGERND